MTLLGVLLASAFGALARYLVDGAVQDRVGGVFPWGTFVINVSGSLVVGVIAGLALDHGLPDAATAILGIGFCGAYTTFSTFTYETVRLVEEGARISAFTNVVASVFAGLAAGGIGLAFAAAI